VTVGDYVTRMSGLERTRALRSTIALSTWLQTRHSEFSSRKLE
jgi:hypothetical protein